MKREHEISSNFH
ncbi:hypothetical protein RDI58_000831 [Solanum bulbocastanum]|uniref:Uncharacterized protein n=1 Tax=Solanum bulbocastanum TaxID=147425 RepID=A0AAN8U1W6_SOLBU